MEDFSEVLAILASLRQSGIIESLLEKSNLANYSEPDEVCNTVIVRYADESDGIVTYLENWVVQTVVDVIKQLEQEHQEFQPLDSEEL